jgi:hypothetical protein
MAKRSSKLRFHPAGGGVLAGKAASEPLAVNTFGGKIDVVWDASARVTAFGPVSFFLDFLKTSGRWQRFVESCPLAYTSGNAPTKEEILGTILVSVLAGHTRYAHVTSIRQDNVLPGMLGIETFRSEDAVRRAFLQAEEEALTTWLDVQMNDTFEEMLEWPYALDVDATVKTLYGKQEAARVGYNPHKLGRASHVYYTYVLGGARLVLNVDVHPGNQTAAEYAQPGLWGWLDSRPREQWPKMLRGDIAFGNEKMMTEAEQRKLPYLFRLRRTAGVERLLTAAWKKDGWEKAGDGWWGREEKLKLQGWSQDRRVIVLRRKIEGDLAAALPPAGRNGQLMLAGMEMVNRERELYEFAVLVTNLEEKEVLTLAHWYRQRADAENVFDEMKNQWGWAGFVTKDLMRTQVMARIIALIFNWWSIYTRLALPGRHTEAVTSRPLLLHGIARETTHSQRTKLTITSSHGKRAAVAGCLRAVSGFLKTFWASAEQLGREQGWRLLLRKIFAEFYRSVNVKGALPAPA